MKRRFSSSTSGSSFSRSLREGGRAFSPIYKNPRDSSQTSVCGTQPLRTQNGLQRPRPVMYQLQESLRNVDLRSFINTDLGNWLGKMDFKTVGLVALAALVVLLVLDLFTKGPTPYGRSLVSSAANAWDSIGQTGFSQSLRGSRSLEPVVTVLDALTEAAKKWEAPEDSVVRNRAL
nr:uncharacterized protein LOC113821575 [Penaeus vannamei]